MRYTWACPANHETVVERRMADIECAPYCCETCASTDLRRVIARDLPTGVKGFVLEGSGWHDQLYGKNRPNS